MPILLSHLNNINCEIIALCETWSKSDSIIPHIQGFNALSCPSVSGKSGGLIIYYRNYLNVKKISLLDVYEPNSDSEYLAVNVLDYNLLILLAYRHPVYQVLNFMSSLNDILASSAFNNPNKSIIFVGDTNIDTLKENRFTKNYVKSFKALHYKSLIDNPTRSNQSSQSCIDHVFVKSDNNVTATINDFQITDHSTITIQYTASSSSKEFIHFRQHKKKNIDQLRQSLNKINWDAFFDNNNTLDKVTNDFCSLIYHHYNVNCAVKTKRINKSMMVPWITRNIKIMISRKKI